MGSMKFIYGGEIARLVLGYLRETDRNIFEQFLRVSPFLIDIRAAHEDGEELNLLYLNKMTLKDILQEYAYLYSVFHRKIDGLSKSEKIRLSEKSFPENFDILLNSFFSPSEAATAVPSCHCAQPQVSCETQTESQVKHVFSQTTPQENVDDKKSPAKNAQSQSSTHDVMRLSVSTQTDTIRQELNVTVGMSNLRSSPLPDIPTTPGSGLCMSMNLQQQNESSEEGSSVSNAVTQPRDPMDVDQADHQVFPSKLVRSQSCSDLPNAGPSDVVLKARRSFFTPNKRLRQECSRVVLQSRLPEMIENRDFVDKLVKSINHARAEVTELEELDHVVQSIIDKTTADPSFNEMMDETLGSFDMLQLLRPKGGGDEFFKSADNSSQSASVLNPAPEASIMLSSSTVSTAASSVACTSAVDAISFPDVSYLQTENIYITDVNEKGDVVFYSNPRCPSNGLFLPPPPPRDSSKSARYRRIQPKVPEPAKSSGINVVVCTPLVPANTASEPISTKKRKQPKAIPSTTTRKTRSSGQVMKTNDVVEPDHVLIPPTPGRVYTEDMPFLFTPQISKDAPPECKTTPERPVDEKTPPGEEEPKNDKSDQIQTVDATVESVDSNDVQHIPPEVTPHQGPPQRIRKSHSTPRRKSYIRTLEFETPQKKLESKKCVTLPKQEPPKGSVTPSTSGVTVDQVVEVEVQKSKVKSQSKKVVLNNKKSPKKSSNLTIKSGKLPRSAIKIAPSPKHKNSTQKTDAADPPMASRTPNPAHLSEFWDPLKTVMGDVSPKSTTFDNTTINASEIAVLSSTTKPVDDVQVKQPAKTWDSLLRNCVGNAEPEPVKAPRAVHRRRRIRPKNSPKKPKINTSEPRAAKKPRLTRSKTAKMSPSKKRAKSTTKRSTYAISHGSSSAFDSSSSDEEVFIEVCVKKPDVSEITPAKIDPPANPCEETPFTKLLRENVDCVDIDLSMIQTPVFPPTPSINYVQEPVTPLHDTRRTDYSSGSSYYKPDLSSPVSVKEIVALETVAEMERSEEHLQDVSTTSGRNLVLTPDEDNLSPVKKNKITNYFKPADSSVVNLNSSVQDLNKTVEDRFINVTSDDSVCEQTTVVDLSSMAHKTVEPLKVGDDAQVAAASKDVHVNSKSITSQKEPEFVPPNAVNAVKPSDKKETSKNVQIKDIVCQGQKMLARRKLPGKHMGMLKLQMIAQCDIKLGENIPISARSETTSEDNNSSVNSPAVSRERDLAPVNTCESTQSVKSVADKSTIPQNQRTISNVFKTMPSLLTIGDKFSEISKTRTTNVREELEVKRLEMIRKVREGESLKRSRKPLTRPTKRVRSSSKKTEVLSAPLVCSTPNKSDSSRLSLSVSDADNTLKPESPIVNFVAKTSEAATNSRIPSLTEDKTTSGTKENNSPGGILPPFVDDGEFPELRLNTKKKLFAVKFILEREEVSRYLENYGRTKEKIRLKSSLRGMFRAMFKWLSNPNEKEHFSEKVQERVQLYYSKFQKVNEGLASKSDKSLEESGSTEDSKGNTQSRKTGGKSPGRLKVLLPLKKRKNPEHVAKTKGEVISGGAGEASRTDGTSKALVKTASQQTPLCSTSQGDVTDAHSILQDIDVDRFLSKVHGHDS